MVEDWYDDVVEIDKIMRDRLLILTVAAERGWKVASDLAFAMKGKPLSLPSKEIHCLEPDYGFQVIWLTSLLPRC
jgi:hypothetical protein